ncbi:MAG: hypothetical protein AAF658_09045, partial [Myxococcota bacterium]
MTRGACFAFIGVLCAIPVDAQAIDFWPFKSQDQQLLDEVRHARETGELKLAVALLEQLRELRPNLDPEVLLEDARLSVALGELEAGAAKLDAAAVADPMSSAREELAAVYVRIGRWPDAVKALRLAFDERGSSMPADALRADPRFAELVGFEPFDDLVDRVREAQAGPMGRMLIRLERLEETARDTMTAIEQLSELIALVARVATSFFLPLVCFVFFGLLCTFGVSQLSPLGRPWTLLTGFGAAGTVWSSGVRTFSAGGANGLETVLLGSGVVIGAWVILALLTLAIGGVRRYFRVDPWAPEQRDATL